MREKKRTDNQPAAPSPTGFGGSAPPENRNVSISSGPYAEDLPVAGSTVGSIRQKYRDRFDIASNAQAIVNGHAVDDDTVLNVGEALMFIQHAGEKGDDEVVIKGQRARYSGMSMDLTRMLERAGPAMSTGPVILPYGIKTVLSRGPITLWLYEQPPRIQRLSWIAADSPRPYGPGTKYRWVRIALPYLIIVATFVRDGIGMPQLIGKDECFFRTEPLKSLNDELCYPGLLNCSSWGDDSMDHPLSWICTQHLKHNKQMESADISDRFQGGFEAVRYCLLETSFNLSSEHHEGNSWYGRTKKVDPRIATVENWEKNTQKDPLFVLDVPWLKAGHSVKQLTDRIFQQLGSSVAGVRSASDLARIITNG